jgi:hypothetical protein
MLPFLFLTVNGNPEVYVQIVPRFQICQCLVLEGVFFDVDVELSTTLHIAKKSR